MLPNSLSDSRPIELQKHTKGTCRHVMDGFNLDQGTELCRVLGDPTRVRLLLLLEFQELTVAELTQVTELAQSRVSTHLGKLRNIGLINDRRHGASTFYSLSSDRVPDSTSELWDALRKNVADARIERDRERAREIVRARKRNQTWAESVAGRMELHYSPGRTWEATARGVINLLELGDVLDCGSGDGVLAELLAHRARSVKCMDLSAKVVAAGTRRLAHMGNVTFLQGDMHAMPLAESTFDVVFLMHTLTFTLHPGQVLGEVARVLKPGGRTVVTTLKTHEHQATVNAYDHVNRGFDPAELTHLLTGHGLRVESCEVTSRESRPPFFEIVTALAQRPD